MNYQHKSMKTYTLLACAIAAWCTLPSYSMAESGMKNLVIVRASRAEEVAKQEPQRVAIITQKAIEEKQAKSVEEVIFTQTGVSKTVDRMGRVGVSIRGAEPRHTLILVDGKPVMGDFAKYMGASDEVMRLGTENVDHIEIVQGAASAKYGADAIGGVVNVITKEAAKKPMLRFNIEGRRLAQDGGTEIAPYSNFFLRADTGKIGKLRVAVYGNKRDIMPVYATAERIRVMGDTVPEDMPKNSLRYYGTNANIGFSTTYDINQNNSITLRSEHFTENLERFIKRSTSELEPQQHFKRHANRDTTTLQWKGRKGDSIDWTIDANFSHIKENDIALTSDFGKNNYEGKNTLNYIDNIDHKQYSINASINKQVNEKHLVTVGFGATQEEGRGSRIKNAPKSYVIDIDPWDYDKSLYVNPKTGKVSSKVHAYHMEVDKNDIPRLNLDYEWYGYNAKDPNSVLPEFTFSDFQQYIDPTSILHATDKLDNAPAGETPEDRVNRLRAKAAYESFNNKLIEANKDLFTDDFDEANYDGKIFDSLANRSTMVIKYYTNQNPNIKLNGGKFASFSKLLDNKVEIGEAKVKKQHAFIQDLWQKTDNTAITTSLRLDHSDLFGSNVSAAFGIKHNVHGDPHKRLKFNLGTGYSEPGLGELYYNWEMYGGNPIGFGVARLGWYWAGNPNLKPEKSLNFDLGYETENKNTSYRFGLFHNRIKDYLSVYFTGQLMDFHPELNEHTGAGIFKFFFAPDMIYSFKNIGKAEISGLDFEVKHQFNKHIGSRLGYTLLHAINKSDKTMPRKLLDKPTHKIDIGLDFKDEKSGWSASLWGDYYIKMLDSNTVANNGNIMESYGPLGGTTSTIHYYFAKEGEQTYEEKTFGIWNLMIQKKLDKDAMAYFGVDNLFNHHDDDRATQSRVYRFGMNFKLADVFDTKTVIDPVTGKPVIVKMSDFFSRPFDTHRTELGAKVIGDLRVRNNTYLGENKPAAKITFTSAVGSAEKNVLDKEGSSLETRLRFGVDSRIAENTNFTFITSLDSHQGVDTSETTFNKGPKHARIENLDFTQHHAKWDYSIGRLTERMGVTGTWFGKEFDGGRVVWTSDKMQIRAGVGSFRQSTGVIDSAYTRATYGQYFRPPTTAEVIGFGIKDGTFSEYEDVDTPNGNSNVNFWKQLQEAAEKDKATGDIKEQVKVIKHMFEVTTAAYPDYLQMSDTKDGRRKNQQFHFTPPMISVEFQDSNGNTVPLNVGFPDDIDEAIQNNAILMFLNEYEEYPSYNVFFSNYYEIGENLPNSKSEALNEYWAKKGNDVLKAYEERSRAETKKTGDSVNPALGEGAKFVRIVDTPEEIKAKMVEANYSKPADFRFQNNPIPFSEVISDYFYTMQKLLRDTDGGSLLPRADLGSVTGYMTPTMGTVLVRDEIPTLDKAVFAQAKYKVNDHLGVAAWFLRSIGDEDHSFITAYEKGNETANFNRLANVFGIGARWQLGDRVALSVDAGINKTDFGRYMNGSTVYEHATGTSEFTIKGHHVGTTPKFWTVRFDVGSSDTEVPGSWNAFVDYKHFEHGAFFGGNGTESLPDRYLDGIKSFTFGAGYVPAKNWLIEAFYTFDAEGINKRDTLYGSENFRLGNYTRAQITYKF